MKPVRKRKKSTRLVCAEGERERGGKRSGPFTGKSKFTQQAEPLSSVFLQHFQNEASVPQRRSGAD